MSMENNIVVAIDPGKNGGIVVMDRYKVYEQHLIPVLGKVVDTSALAKIFKDIKGRFPTAPAVIEQVHAIFGVGAGTTFEFGRIFGMLEMALAKDFAYTLVQPKIWQKVAWQGIPEIRKPGKMVKKKDGTEYMKQGSVETKKMALAAVGRLFPNEELRATERSKIKHDGLVDRLLAPLYTSSSTSLKGTKKIFIFGPENPPMMRIIWAEVELLQKLKKFKEEAGEGLFIYSTLEPGVSISAAKIALDLGIPVIGCIPFDGFHTRFNHDYQKEYRSLCPNLHHLQIAGYDSDYVSYRKQMLYILNQANYGMILWDQDEQYTNMKWISLREGWKNSGKVVYHINYHKKETYNFIT